MPNNLFCENFLTIQYTLGNIIKETILVSTCVTRFFFIKQNFLGIFCKKLKIQLQCLIKTKQIQRFDGKAACPITHALYPTLSIRNYTKSLVFLLLTKLRQRFMILGYP